MTTVDVISQEQLKRYRCDEPHINISVRNSWEELFELPQNILRLDALRLAFDDIVIPTTVHDFGTNRDVELVLFDISHAKQIAEFVIKHKDVKYIIVNCFAGISRSAGIAEALQTWDSKKYIWRRRMSHRPNDLVYKTLLQELKKGS